MPEHEPLDIADEDNDRAEKTEARGARAEGTTPTGLDTPTDDASSANMASDDAQAASEPMDLQRLPEKQPPPPGRQRTGDPPAPSRQ